MVFQKVNAWSLEFFERESVSREIDTLSRYTIMEKSSVLLRWAHISSKYLGKFNICTWKCDQKSISRPSMSHISPESRWCTIVINSFSQLCSPLFTHSLIRWTRCLNELNYFSSFHWSLLWSVHAKNVHRLCMYQCNIWSRFQNENEMKKTKRNNCWFISIYFGMIEFTRWGQ